MDYVTDAVHLKSLKGKYGENLYITDYDCHFFGKEYDYYLYKLINA